MREVLFVNLLPVIIACTVYPVSTKRAYYLFFEACVAELEIGVRGDTNVGTMLATYGWLGRSQSTRPDSVPDSGPYRDISTFNTAHVVTTEDKIR